MLWIASIAIIFNLILSLVYLRIKNTQLKGSENFKSKGGRKSDVSIVVCLRNEEENLPSLITALLSQKYSGSHEVILVNDGSSDKTGRKIEELAPKAWKIIHFERNKGKKSGLIAGVEIAKNSVILTTDADCIPNPGWIKNMLSCLESSKADMVTGPVEIRPNRSWISQMQHYQMNALMRLTSNRAHKNSFKLANGANMAFRKKVFSDLRPYENNMHISSGDDMYLARAITNENSTGLVFCDRKNAMVTTEPKNTLKEWFYQQLRWAGKNKLFPDRSVFAASAGLWLCNISVLICLFGLPCLITYPLPFLIALIMVIVFRVIQEFRLTRSLTKKGDSLVDIVKFPAFFLLHTIWVILIGAVSLFRTEVQWRKD